MAAAAMLILTTCGSAEEADALAAKLVGAGQAACVNRIDGVWSTYRWQGAVRSEREVLLLIKTTEDRIPVVERTVREHSSYELPELVAVRIDTGMPAYLDWLRSAVDGS